MHLIVGLGNPGDRFEGTRHNVGFEFIDQFADLEYSGTWQRSKRLKANYIKADDIILAKPATYMNASGDCVNVLVTYYSLNAADIYIVHDDLDIRLGEYKIQRGRGPRLHNGIRSIERSLGFNDFWRVRLGIENRSVENKITGDNYVLSRFDKEEKRVVDDTIKRAIGELQKLNLSA